jgi:hypothetical protein
MLLHIAETYSDKGNSEEFDRLFASFLDNSPRNGRGWIAWADQYSFKVKDANKDYEKATHASPALSDDYENVDLREIRRIISITAAAAVLGAALFSSGFVSPVMADSIKRIPFLGSIFSTMEADIGLRTAGKLGLTSAGNSEVSYEDVQLRVIETVFDGTRAAFLLEVTAPNLTAGQYDTGRKIVKLSDAIENITIQTSGAGEAGPNVAINGMYYSDIGDAHPNTLLFEHIIPNATSDTAPQSDSFNAEVSVKQEGIEHVFKLDIAFHLTSQNIIHIKPNQSLTAGNTTFTLSELHVTPLTTRLSTAITFNDKLVLNKKESKKLGSISVAVFDDQGHQLPALNGEGTYEGTTLSFDSRYASTPGQSKFLTLKPFVIEDDFAEVVREKQFIKGLEMKIELPSTPQSA